MEKEEIDQMLLSHQKWLDNGSGKRANFSHEILTGFDFSYRNLHSASFRFANLQSANFQSAILSRALFNESDVRFANFCRADLACAEFCGANLLFANFTMAILKETDFDVANLGGAEFLGSIDGHICRLDFEKWSVCIRSEFTTIGCEKHANRDWLSWSHDSPEISKMHVDASEWWRIYGPAVKAAIMTIQQLSEK